MANKKAVANGLWGNPATWEGGTLPLVGDDVYANGFTVTIEADRTAASVRTTANTGIVAGGEFALNGNVTLTANVFAGTTNGVAFIFAGNATIVGNVTGGSAASAFGARNENDGHLTIQGIVTGGTHATAQGAQNATVGTLTVIGNPVNTTATNALQNGSTGTINVTGNVICTVGAATSVINNVGGGVINVDGNVQGGTIATGYGINLAGPGGTLNVEGDVTGGNALTTVACPAIIMSGLNNTVNVTGTVRGGPNTGTVQYGISTVTAGDVVNVTGAVEAGGGSHGINGVAGSIITVNGDCSGGTTVGAGYGIATLGTLTVNGNCLGGVLPATGGGVTYTSSALNGPVVVNGNCVGRNGVGLAYAGQVSLVVDGDCLGGTGAGAAGLTITAGANGVADVTGAVTGGTGTTSHGVANATASPLLLNITGNCTGGNSTGNGYNTTGAASTTNITGNVIGGTASTASGVGQGSLGTVNVFGDAIGGTAAANYGLNQTGAGATNLWGTARGTNVPGNLGHGANVAANTTAFIQVAVGNDYPNAGMTTAAYGITATSTAAAVTVDALEDGSGGLQPTNLARVFMRDVGANYVKSHTSNLGPVLTLGEVTDYPAPEDVRAATEYSFGTLVGTLAVPSPDTVSAGVPVDDTVGVAVNTPEGLLGADLLERLRNCSTVGTVGDQLAAFGSP